MKEIINGNHEIFKTRSRKAEVVRQRQEVYYHAFQKYQSPQKIQKYLLENYDFSVNQSTIYYSWRKVMTSLEELTPQQFEKDNEIFNKYELAERYAAYQLSLHSDGYMRGDIRHKIQKLTAGYDESMD